MTNLISFIATGLLIIGSMLLYLIKYKGEIFSHFTFVAVICFLVEVLGPMIWLINGQTHYRGYQVMAYGAKASLFFCIGYLAFCITYFYKNPLGTNWTYERTDTLDYSDMKVSRIWVAYILFFVLYVIYLRLRGRSLLSQLTFGQQGDYNADYLVASSSNLWFLLITINCLATCAILLLFYQKNNKILKYLVYIVTMLLTITSGRRHLMLDLAIAPIITYSVINKKKIRISAAIITVIIAYLLVGWIGAMRSVYRYGVGEVSGFELDSAFTAFMYNIEVFFPFFMFVGSGKYFAYGGTYLAGILSLIPSSIFPNKAVVLATLKGGVNYSLLTGGDESFNRGGVADNFWCEGYKNFGLIGIILAFIILAIVITKLHKKMYSETVSTVVVYSLTITFLFQVLTRSFQNMLQDAVGLFLPIFLIHVLTSGRISIKRHT